MKLKLPILLMTGLTLVSCALKTVYPKNKHKEFETVFSNFSNNENYHLSFDVEYSSLAGLSKKDAKETRKGLMQQAVEDIVSFIYSLPLAERKQLKTYCPTSELFESDEIKIPCGYRNEKNHFVKAYSPFTFIEHYRKNNGNRNPPYVIEDFDTEKINFNLISSSDYSAKLKWNVKAIGNKTFSKPITSITKGYYHPNRHKIIFAKQETRGYSTPKVIGMNVQHLATKHDGKDVVPVVAGSLGLDKFIKKNTFQEIDKKRFQVLFKDKVFKLVEDFNIHNGDKRDLILYLKKMYLSGYLFFNYGPSTDGFNKIDQYEFNRFLNDEDRRRRMLGLTLVAYSKFKPERISKNTLRVDVEIDIKKMFKEIKFVNVDGLMEK